MDKERILATLRQHEAELKAAGIVHLRLFGSVARGEATPESDVDLLFECEPPSLFRIYGSQDEFAAMLGVKVHLSSEKYLRPEFRDHVLSETVDVF
jgi:predicted nucleotidyltransferase